MAITVNTDPHFSFYGYVPSKNLNLAAAILFGIVGVGQLYYGLKYKKRWFSLFFLAGIARKFTFLLLCVGKIII